MNDGCFSKLIQVAAYCKEGALHTVSGCDIIQNNMRKKNNNCFALLVKCLRVGIILYYNMYGWNELRANSVECEREWENIENLRKQFYVGLDEPRINNFVLIEICNCSLIYSYRYHKMSLIDYYLDSIIQS